MVQPTSSYSFPIPPPFEDHFKSAGTTALLVFFVLGNHDSVLLIQADDFSSLQTNDAFGETYARCLHYQREKKDLRDKIAEELSRVKIRQRPFDEKWNETALAKNFEDIEKIASSVFFKEVEEEGETVLLKRTDEERLAALQRGWDIAIDIGIKRYNTLSEFRSREFFQESDIRNIEEVLTSLEEKITDNYPDPSERFSSDDVPSIMWEGLKVAKELLMIPIKKCFQFFCRLIFCFRKGNKKMMC